MAKKAKQAHPWPNRIVDYKEVEVGQLLANEANWRIHPKEQYEALSRVMKGVGIVQNIVLNARTSKEWPVGQRGVETMVDGHCRAITADRDGQGSLPATVVDLSPSEERLVLATLDPLSAMATMDAEATGNLLREIVEGGDKALLEGAWPDWKIDPLLAADWTPKEPEDMPTKEPTHAHSIGFNDEQWEVVLAAQEKADGAPLAEVVVIACEAYASV